MKSINESYRTLGQDGRRFNESVISPANTRTCEYYNGIIKFPTICYRDGFEIKTDIPSSIDDRHSAGSL